MKRIPIFLLSLLIVCTACENRDDNSINATIEKRIAVKGELIYKSINIFDGKPRALDFQSFLTDSLMRKASPNVAPEATRQRIIEAANALGLKEAKGLGMSSEVISDQLARNRFFLATPHVGYYKLIGTKEMSLDEFAQLAPKNAICTMAGYFNPASVATELRKAQLFADVLDKAVEYFGVDLFAKFDSQTPLIFVLGFTDIKGNRMAFPLNIYGSCRLNMPPAELLAALDCTNKDLKQDDNGTFTLTSTSGLTITVSVDGDGSKIELAFGDAIDFSEKLTTDATFKEYAQILSSKRGANFAFFNATEFRRFYRDMPGMPRDFMGMTPSQLAVSCLVEDGFFYETIAAEDVILSDAYTNAIADIVVLLSPLIRAAIEEVAAE